MERYESCVPSGLYVVDVGVGVFQDLCTRLLELIGIASSDLKREAIASLPEIIDDSQHTTAAAHLK